MCLEKLDKITNLWTTTKFKHFFTDKLILVVGLGNNVARLIAHHKVSLDNYICNNDKGANQSFTLLLAGHPPNLCKEQVPRSEQTKEQLCLIKKLMR